MVCLFELGLCICCIVFNKCWLGKEIEEEVEKQKTEGWYREVIVVGQLAVGVLLEVIL